MKYKNDKRSEEEKSKDSELDADLEIPIFGEECALTDLFGNKRLYLCTSNKNTEIITLARPGRICTIGEIDTGIAHAITCGTSGTKSQPKRFTQHDEKTFAGTSEMLFVSKAPVEKLWSYQEESDHSEDYDKEDSPKNIPTHRTA